MTDYNLNDGINQIHNYRNRIERNLERLKEMNSFNSNKIIEFHKEIKINGISEATQTKYLDRLITISSWVDKDFDKLTRDELIEIIGKYLTSEKYTESTKKTLRIIIKRFFQWLKKTPKGEYPIEVSWLKSGSNNKSRSKNPEDMLNDEDIEKMVNAVSHPRDKAFIMTLAESGTIISELLSLTIRRVCFDNRGCFFKVSGKTGDRRVRVVNSTPFLHAWLEIHPNKNDDNAPLWINIGTTKHIWNDNEKNNINNYKMNWHYNMSYAAARKLLQVAAKKAGIKKPINPHNYRHSKATLMASQGIPPLVMAEYLGWVPSTNMYSVYCHLSGIQVDDILLSKAYGIKTEEKESTPKMFPLKCFSCGELNSYNATRCKKCNSIIGQLSNEDLEEEKTMSQMLKLFGGMVDKNSDLKTQFIDSIKKDIMNEIRLSSQKEKIKNERR